MQISKEFPELLSIEDSLVKYVFEPNQKKVTLCSQISKPQTNNVKFILKILYTHSPQQHAWQYSPLIQFLFGFLVS